jgi:hypothetical protein
VIFAAITLCVASQQVCIVVGVYFVIDSVRKLLDTHSYGVTLILQINKGKGKIVPVLKKYNAMKTYGEVEVQLHTFLTSTLD